MELGAPLDPPDRENTHTRTPLMRAVDYRLPSLVEHFLESGADPNTSFRGMTALHSACDGAQNLATYSIITLLLRYGANPNAIDPARHCGPVHMLASLGASLGLGALLDAGGDPNLVASTSPLIEAIDANSVTATDLLLRRGAQLTPVNGRDPRLLALSENTHEAIRIVIRAHLK
jgi:ankyrin repeat protein